MAALPANCSLSSSSLSVNRLTRSISSLLVVLSHIGVMLSTTAFNLEKCTLAQAHPEWLVRGISRAQPLWHITDHCTFDRPTVLPAVCPLCLSDDLRAGHSQYLRLAWYCSILTICPVHRTPTVTCCSAEVWHHRFATKAGMPIHRSCCLEMSPSS
jgi:hypothetical protein